MFNCQTGWSSFQKHYSEFRNDLTKFWFVWLSGGVLFFIVAIIVSVCTVKICNRRKRRKQEQGKQTNKTNKAKKQTNDGKTERKVANKMGCCQRKIFIRSCSPKVQAFIKSSFQKVSQIIFQRVVPHRKTNRSDEYSWKKLRDTA